MSYTHATVRPSGRQAPLLLVCGSRFTQNALARQLRSILPGSIPLSFYLIDEKGPEVKGEFFVVFSSNEVFEEFKKLNTGGVTIAGSVIAERTILNERLDTILTLPRNQQVLLVNESKASALESVAHMKNIGFDFIQLIPYYPGAPLPDPDITIAITPGESDKVPPGIKAVYDIGSRALDFNTIVRILSYYGILEEVIPAYADRYLRKLLRFAMRLSNVADEATQVMTTVRTELIGSGYFAKYRFSDIIGQSPAIRHAKDIAGKIARTDLTVLIEGDNGTGKELFASAIHNASSRARQPFVAINLSALPDQLVESELFGYEEGAFTGARKKGKIGLFQQAAGGTIFLDEIGDISLTMQAKLLRVIQEHSIMKVGGDRIIPVDVRIIAATNRDLRRMIEEKTFRKDLYYRLREGYLSLPSLIQRREDIPRLISHWQERQFFAFKQISPEVADRLMLHDWPGNVRELLNLMKFLSAVCEGDQITVDDLVHLAPMSLLDQTEAEPFAGETEERPEAAASGARLPGEDGATGDALAPADAASVPFLSIAQYGVLEAVYQITLDGRLAGRGNTSKLLQKRGMQLPEYRVRKCLRELVELGLLWTKPGRYGLVMTPLGLAALSHGRGLSQSQSVDDDPK